MNKTQDFAKTASLERDILCLTIDGRRDQTKTLSYDEETVKYHESVVLEEHYNMTIEPSGDYADHFVPEETTKTEPHAKQIAKGILTWLQDNDAEEALIALAADSTNTNTGFKGGTMAFVENAVGRPLIWLVCMLHTNETSFRNLMISLDGPTTHTDGLNGNVVKLVDRVHDISYNLNFERVDNYEELLDLLDNVVADLSSDQNHAYRLWRTVRTGEIAKDLQNVKCRILNPVRWLTCANRLCSLWMREHKLQGQGSQNFKFLMEWGCYYSM